MEMLFMLTGISLILALIFLGAFIWAAKSGQFEDDFTPSIRILFDDSTIQKESKSTANKSLDATLNKKSNTTYENKKL